MPTLKELSPKGVEFNQKKYEYSLRKVSEYFGIELPTGCNQEHANYILNFGQRVARWLADKHYIFPQDRKIPEQSLESMILIPHSLRASLAIGIKKRKIDIASEAIDRYLAATTPAERSNNDLAVIHNSSLSIEHQKKQIKKIESDPSLIAPATTYVIDEKGLPKKLIVFSDWSDEENPYHNWTLQAAIAEETIHSACKNESLERFFNQQQRHSIEELAVKYYVVEALTEIGVEQEKIDQYLSNNLEGAIAVWALFVKEVGKKVASEFFFHGVASQDLVNRLLVIIDKARKQGIVS